MKTEIWKDIPGFEGLYQVSNLDGVKSLNRISKGNSKLKGKIINGHNDEGYRRLGLRKDGKQKIYRVHRLVLAAFKGLDLSNLKILGLHKCEKLDKNGFLDNSLDNLFIGTQKDNIRDCIKKGRHKYILPDKSKKVNQYDLAGNFIKAWISVINVQKHLGYSSQNISQCALGKNKTAYGYIWKYT